MAFPASIPANTDPVATDKLASPGHSALHRSHNAEIVAVETKVGTGSSTPVANRVLRGNGTGTSAWAQVDPSTDLTTLTSATLRALITDETGTGSAVFGTSPSITTPAITSPSITTSINDSNGNEVIKTPATASATNEITVTNAITGASPVIAATGSSDINIDLTLTPKGTGTVKTSPVNKIDWTALPLGSVVQIVDVNSSAVATGVTVIPVDDTIPQITEGDQYMTLAITPKSVSNILVIEANVFGSVNAATQNVVAALFQDATANGLAATQEFGDTSTGVLTLSLYYSMAAGTTSSTTFRVRAGTGATGTFTFNGASATRRFGTVTKSWMRIIEYKA